MMGNCVCPVRGEADHATFIAGVSRWPSRPTSSIADQPLRLHHDPIDQLSDGWDVMDQANNHAAAPRAGVHVTINHDLGIDAGQAKVR